jgi:hypothetical protein
VNRAASELSYVLNLDLCLSGTPSAIKKSKVLFYDFTIGM